MESGKYRWSVMEFGKWLNFSENKHAAYQLRLYFALWQAYFSSLSLPDKDANLILLKMDPDETGETFYSKFLEHTKSLSNLSGKRSSESERALVKQCQVALRTTSPVQVPAGVAYGYKRRVMAMFDSMVNSGNEGTTISGNIYMEYQ